MVPWKTLGQAGSTGGKALTKRSMNLYKIFTGTFLITTIIFASLWIEGNSGDTIDTYTVDAASSVVKELPYRLEDVRISFDSFHKEDASAKEHKYAETLLARSLQQLTGNQRLLNAAERSNQLEKPWFQDYFNELFTLRSIMTAHSFEKEQSDQAEAIASQLTQLQADVQYIVDKESFTVTDKEKMNALTETIRTFNEQFLS